MPSCVPLSLAVGIQRRYVAREVYRWRAQGITETQPVHVDKGVPGPGGQDATDATITDCAQVRALFELSLERPMRTPRSRVARRASSFQLVGREADETRTHGS